VYHLCARELASPNHILNMELQKMLESFFSVRIMDSLSAISALLQWYRQAHELMKLGIFRVRDISNHVGRYEGWLLLFLLLYAGILENSGSCLIHSMSNV
jgi:hypothetical protein